jgi:hypothetical protein
MLTRARAVMRTSNVPWRASNSAIQNRPPHSPFQHLGRNNVLVVEAIEEKQQTQFFT